MHLPGYFEFCCPVQIIAGHRAIDNLPALLKKRHVRKPMLVTDQGVVGARLVDVVTAAISQSVAIGQVVDDIPSDPDLETVRRIARCYRENDCDGLVAVGGGSVMDAAKGANLLVSEKKMICSGLPVPVILKGPCGPFLPFRLRPVPDRK